MIMDVIFLILIWSGLSLQARPTAQHDPPLVHLELGIIQQEYCPGDAELDRIRLKLRLRFTNSGSDNVILYKGSNVVIRIMVSRDVDSAQSHVYEVDGSLTTLYAGDPKINVTTLPNKLFVILRPTEFFETTRELSVFVVRDDVRRITGAILSGDHVLQIQVLTWPDSVKPAEKLRADWQDKGLLWYDALVSAPVKLHVPKTRTIKQCP